MAEHNRSLRWHLFSVLLLVALMPLFLLLYVHWDQRRSMEAVAPRWLVPQVDVAAADMADGIEVAVGQLLRLRAQVSHSPQEVASGMPGGGVASWQGVVSRGPGGDLSLLSVEGRMPAGIDRGTLLDTLRTHLEAAHPVGALHLLRMGLNRPSGYESPLLLLAEGENQTFPVLLIEAGRLFTPLLQHLRDLRTEGFGAARVWLSKDLADAIPRLHCVLPCAGLEEGAPTSLRQALLKQVAGGWDHGVATLPPAAGGGYLVWARLALPAADANDWWIALEVPHGLFAGVVTGSYLPYWLAGLVVLALALGLAAWSSHRVIGPLRSLSQGMLQASEEGAVRVVPLPFYREFAPFTESWRRMAEILEERRRLQQQLQSQLEESRRLSQYYRTLLEAVPEAVMVVDGDGRIVESNPAAERLTGHAAAALAGRPVEEFVPACVRNGHHAQHERYAEDPCEICMGTLADVTLVDAQCREIPVDVSLSPMEIDGQRHVVAVIRDLREPLRIQSELRRLAMVARHTDNMVVITDAEVRIEWVNPAFEKASGYTLGEVIGRNPGELFGGEGAGRKVRSQIRAALDQGRSVSAELLNHRRDGSTFWVELEITPVKNEQGGVEHFIAIERDITERKQQEQQLLESEARLAEAQRIARMGSWELNVVSGRLLWSDETFHLFGLPPKGGGLEYEDFLQLVHPEDRDRVDEAYRKSLDSGLPYEITHRILLPDGQVRHVEERCETFRDAVGRPIRSVGTVRDVTLREESVRLLEQKRRAEAAAEAKGLFLATVSHEMRTPLHGILGNLELLEHTPLQPHQIQLVQRSLTAGRELLSAVNDVLDLSRIEAGALELERRPFPLRRTLEECVLSLWGTSRRCKVDLVLDMENDLDDRVAGDAQRLCQIVSNLVGNAIKFAAGRMHARVWVRLRLLERGTEALTFYLEVADNGIGMTPEQQQRVFEPFVQAEADTTRRFGGTGLGLSICRELVEKMAGRLELQSEPDVGSRFRVTLTLPRVLDQPLPGPDLAGKRVLLALGDREIASLTGHHLEEAGASVVYCRDLGSLGSACPAEGTAGTDWDLLLLDPEAVEPTLRESLREKGIPVLLLVTDPEATGGEITSGTRMLRYPYTVDELLYQVAVLLGQPDASRGETITDVPLEPLELPASDEEAERQGRLLLVAEDNLINQDVLREQLAMLGYRACIAADGEAALSLFHRHRFAAVLTDANMPRLGGLELVRRIREAESGKVRIPVLVVTADVQNEGAHACAEAGADEVLAKPLSLNRLGQALYHWIEGKDANGAEVTSTVVRRMESQPPVWDVDALARAVGDDKTLQQQFMARFHQAFPRQLERIIRHLHNGDTAAMAGEAHKLKSSAATVGANALAATCETLERAARMNRLDGGVDWIALLKEKGKELEQRLAARRI